MGNIIDLTKIGDVKGTFHERMGMIKDRNNKDLTEYKRLTKYRKNKQKNYTKKVSIIQITRMVWSLI